MDMDSHSNFGYQVPSFVIHPRDWAEVVKASELLRLDPAEFVKVAPYLLARRVIDVDHSVEQRLIEALNSYKPIENREC